MSTTNTDTTAAAPATDAAFLSQLDRIRADLQRQGFAIVRNAVPVEVLDTLRDTLDREFAELRAKGDMFHGGGSFSGHLNCYPRHRRPLRVGRGRRGRHRRHRARSSTRTGRPGRGSTLNYNMPGSVAQHYHMDGVYTRDFLICNVAVVDTDLVNGAIDVLPGTNQRVLPVLEVRHGAQVPRHRPRLPLSQGDVVLRRSTLWHRGMPNLSRRRPADARRDVRRGRRAVDDPLPAERRRDRVLPELVPPDAGSVGSASGCSSPRRSPTRRTASPARCSATRATTH